MRCHWTTACAAAGILVAFTGCVGQRIPSAPPPSPGGADEARAVQEAVAAKLGVTVEVTNSLDMKLRLIPPGEFLMGSPSDERDADINELPQHKVRITKPFYMSACEVTQGQYVRIMGRIPHYDTQMRSSIGTDFPVENVSQGEAADFCRKLSEQEGRTYRLPTEAEWEYACRAGTTTPFYFGDTISTDQANYCGYGVYGRGRPGVFRYKTTPVGSFPPNAFGLFDMHGNIWEWCSDNYSETYYAESPVEDPQGPAAGPLGGVVRGGGWFYGPWHARSAARDRFSSVDRFYYDFGFRIVCGVQTQ